MSRPSACIRATTRSCWTALAELASHRNTLVVVEHDEDTIRRADHVLDLGPAAGVRGGEVVGEGTVEDLIAQPALDHRPLPARAAARIRRSRIAPSTRARLVLKLERIELHNVQERDVRIPLGRLVVDHGRLRLRQVHRRARRAVHEPQAPASSTATAKATATGARTRNGSCSAAAPSGRRARRPRARSGSDAHRQDAALLPCHLRRLLGRHPPHLRRHHRSDASAATRRAASPSTRRAVAAKAAKARACKTIEMSFLPDVKVLCDVCGGRRFNSETLSVSWREKNIGDVLAMNVDDAVEFFRAHPRVHHALKLLQDVGLGYLTLGPAEPDAVGRRSPAHQARHRAREGARRRGRVTCARRPKHTLYVLDEPTVGLHMADVEKLIHVLHRLVDAGNTCGGRRAQPRRDGRGGLDHRHGPGSGRRRWPGGCRRHASGSRSQENDARTRAASSTTSCGSARGADRHFADSRVNRAFRYGYRTRVLPMGHDLVCWKCGASLAELSLPLRAAG